MAYHAEICSDEFNLVTQHIEQRELSDIMVEEMLDGCLDQPSIQKLGQLLVQPRASE